MINGASSGAPTQIASWRNAVFAVFAIMGVMMGTWVSRLPAIRDGLRLGLDEVGILVFAIAVGSVSGLLLASHVVARFGTHATIRAAGFIIAIGFIVAGLGISAWQSIYIAFAGFIAFGALSAITDVAMNVSGAANERASGRTIMPVFHAFFSVGTVVGSGIGVAAEVAGIAICAHFALMAALCLATTLLASRWLVAESNTFQAAAAEERSASGWLDRMRFWADPRTLLVGVMVLCAAMAEGSANDWIALAAVDGHGADNGLASAVLVAFVAAMTIARLAGVKVLDRFGRVPVLRVSFAVAFIGLAAFIFSPSLPMAVIAAVLWGFGAALGFPVGMSAAADDPATAGARVSTVATIGYLSILGGPPIIGFVGEHVGILAALTIPLVMLAIGFLVSSSAREEPLTSATQAQRA